MSGAFPGDGVGGPFVRRGAAVIALVSVVVRLWIGTIQSITALGTANHDDALFLRLAGNIDSGDWLGKYDEFTLAKGPFYSMWIAGCFRFGVPLLLAEHLLYVAACALFVFAMGPALQRTLLRLALFVLLLFNPVSFADGPMSRVIREGIYPAQSLLVLGCIIGLALRIEKPFRVIAGWGIGFGASLSTYWLCREERIWIVPAVLVVVAFAASRRPPWRRALAVGGLSLVTFGYGLHRVQKENQSHYGTSVLTEFTAGAFPDAYGALVRAQNVPASARTPLRAETRERLYAVSPHFAELKKFLEGGVGKKWQKISCGGDVCDDIGGGFVMWALRASATLAKHYGSAADSNAYWTAVTSEVRQACRDGRLTCVQGGSGFLPPLHREDLVAIRKAIVRGISFVSRFDAMQVEREASLGADKFLVDFRDLTRTRLAPVQNGAASLTRQAAQEARVQPSLTSVIRTYQRGAPYLSVLSLIAYAAGLVFAGLRRRCPPLLVISSTLLVATVTRIAVVAMVDVTSFSSLNVGYLSPAYPLLLAFIALAGPALVEAVRLPRAGSANRHGESVLPISMPAAK